MAQDGPGFPSRWKTTLSTDESDPFYESPVLQQRVRPPPFKTQKSPFRLQHVVLPSFFISFAHNFYHSYGTIAHLGALVEEPEQKSWSLSFRHETEGALFPGWLH